MNTVGNDNSSVPPTVNPPANPAKGNQRGQTTLAAEIDRWQAMAANMAPQIDQLPGLKEPFAEFQAALTEAETVRNQINTLKAGLGTAFDRRNQLLVDGGALFSRLQLGLQAVHGPRSPRLREFGLKPRGLRTGRPRKTTTSTPPPAVEVATPPPAGTVPPTAASPKE